MLEQKLCNEYLDYYNNYLTTELFGEHRGLTPEEAGIYVKLCRTVYKRVQNKGLYDS